MDGFCGSGGIALSASQHFNQVIANDIDPVKIANASVNAKIYNVESKIDFMVNDIFQVRPFAVDCLVLCPPWGGVEYLKKATFDLTKDIKPDLE